MDLKKDDTLCNSRELAVSNGSRDLHRRFYGVLNSLFAALKALNHEFQRCFQVCCSAAYQIGLRWEIKILLEGGKKEANR